MTDAAIRLAKTGARLIISVSRMFKSLAVVAI